MIMKNMKVSKKLFVGFGVVLALTCAMAFVGFDGLSRVARSVEIADDANSMVKAMLAARRQEKNFMLRGFTVPPGGTQNSVEKLNDAIATLEAQIEETMVKLDKQQDRDDLAEGKRYVEDYKAAAGNYVRLEREDQEAHSRMEDAAQAVLSVVEQLRADQKEKLYAEIESGAQVATIQDRLEKADDADRLTKWMLEVRRHETNYILRGDQQYVDRVTTQIDEMLALLDSMKIRFKDAANDAQADRMIASLKDYEEAFESHTDTVARQYNQETALVEAARGAIEQVEDLRASQKEAMLATQRSATTAALGASGIALLMGIGAALAINKRITGPVTTPQRAPEQIAQGHLQVRVHTQERSELGQLAAAFNQMVVNLQPDGGESPAFRRADTAPQCRAAGRPQRQPAHRQGEAP